MKIFACLILSVALLSAPARLLAVDGPVVLTHELVSASQGPTGALLYFTIHVKNPGETPLANLELTLVPLPPFRPGKSSVSIASLGPHQSTDLEVTAQAPSLEKVDALARAALYFAGRCLDAQRGQLEFPVTSHPSHVGGAQ